MPSPPPDDLDLSGRVALVTGASRGIGRAIAEAYATAGASVVLSSRTQEDLEAVAEAIEARGGTALPVAAHTGQLDTIDALVEATHDAFGGVDILVNNAATNPHFGPILSADESHFTKTFDTNVTGYWRMARACVPTMKERGGGKVINLASVAGEKPMPGMGVYSVSKAGVLMLTEVLASELAVINVQVNAIVPGFVKTEFSKAIWDNDALRDAVLAQTPQRRMAAPDELTGLALYLASAASDFVTGSTFRIDGGLLVGSAVGGS
jgi:NAD(P)-dependent dehydrogenase (short-subunit alcohol dehydrogenase family)